MPEIVLEVNKTDRLPEANRAWLYWLYYYRAFQKIRADNAAAIRGKINRKEGNIKKAIRKEAAYEKKLYKTLHAMEQEHPIIFKMILAILTVILMGLIEDCIHDGIQMAYQQKNDAQESVYILDVDHHYTQIIYKDEEVYIIQGVYIEKEQ